MAMHDSQPRPFSMVWFSISIAVFMGVELLLGGLVGELVVGRYVSHMLALRLQVLLSLGSYLAGGVVIGLISPGVRMLEPALGAAVSVGLTLIIAVFLPYRYMRFSLDRLLVGGGIAFGLALFGAYLGERMAGNIKD